MEVYNLTAEIHRRHRNQYAATVKQACKEISECPCPQKQWEALRVLRVLQDRLRGGATDGHRGGTATP